MKNALGTSTPLLSFIILPFHLAPGVATLREAKSLSNVKSLSPLSIDFIAKSVSPSTPAKLYEYAHVPILPEPPAAITAFSTSSNIFGQFPFSSSENSIPNAPGYPIVGDGKSASIKYPPYAAICFNKGSVWASFVAKNAMSLPYFFTQFGTCSNINCCAPGTPTSLSGSGADISIYSIPKSLAVCSIIALLLEIVS